MKSYSTYNSRLQKGGALIPEMRTLIRIWEPSATTGDLVQRLIEENVLAKNSRARMKDILKRTFLPRYVKGNPPDAWRYLQPFERAGWPMEHMRMLLYYHAALEEKLLYDYVVTDLYDHYVSGFQNISVQEVLMFFQQAVTSGKIDPPWSETVSIKVARGLLAALRDYGILKGKTIKRITKSPLPVRCFVYFAFLIKQEVTSGQRILEHPNWKLFLLEPAEVELLFLEAHQNDLLDYHVAGSVTRLTFPAESLEEYVNVLTQ